MIPESLCHSNMRSDCGSGSLLKLKLILPQLANRAHSRLVSVSPEPAVIGMITFTQRGEEQDAFAMSPTALLYFFVMLSLLFF